MLDRPCWVVALILSCAVPAGAEWLRPSAGGPPEWGIAGGLHWAIWPGSGAGRGTGGPRGLIRISAPCLPGGKYKLVNWLAIEPRTVGGPRGFSELEQSARDGKPGKHLHAAEPAGRITTVAPGVEELEVEIGVERFNNGAHVTLGLSQRSDRPDEIAIVTHTAPGSARLQDCVVTATCGNRTRSRLLLLADGREDSRRLWPDYSGAQFAPDRFFPIARMTRLADGSALAAITTDETNPRAVRPADPRWYYGGVPLVQYWRVPDAARHAGARVRVNGRFMYWATRVPVPGGIAFENFEMREPWAEGQRYVFGVSRRAPAELGIP